MKRNDGSFEWRIVEGNLKIGDHRNLGLVRLDRKYRGLL